LSDEDRANEQTEEPSLGPVYDLKKRAADLADPDNASMAATMAATWSYCLFIGAFGAWIGWWGVGELLLEALVGGFFAGVAAIFVGAIASAFLPGFTGFALGQLVSLVLVAGVVQLMDGDGLAALLAAPLPIGIYLISYFVVQRSAKKQIIEVGLNAELVRELGQLPDQLDRRVHALLDAAVLDYSEIHGVLKTSVRTSDGVPIDEIRTTARAVLTAMLDRAGAISNLVERAHDGGNDTVLREASETALRGLEGRARSLHDTAISLMTYVAQLDDPSRARLQEQVDQLDRIEAAMAELPSIS